jgi:hypothetical protein
LYYQESNPSSRSSNAAHRVPRNWSSWYWYIWYDDDVTSTSQQPLHPPMFLRSPVYSSTVKATRVGPLINSVWMALCVCVNVCVYGRRRSRIRSHVIPQRCAALRPPVLTSSLNAIGDTPGIYALLKYHFLFLKFHPPASARILIRVRRDVLLVLSACLPFAACLPTMADFKLSASLEGHEDDVSSPAN